MKKTLLSLVVLCNALLASAQVSVSATGYENNYNTPGSNHGISNCEFYYNTFASSGITVLDDPSGKETFTFRFDGTQTAYTTASNYITHESCDPFGEDHDTDDYLDMTNIDNRIIKIKVRTNQSVRVAVFAGIRMGSAYTVADGTGALSHIVEANTWTELSFPVPTKTWQNVNLDMTKVIGYSLGVKDKDDNDAAPSGVTTVEVDWVKFGSMAQACSGGDPEITSTSPNFSPCFGDAVTLNTAAIGEGNLSFEWTKSGSTNVLSTNDFLTLSNVSTADAGDYYVTVTDDCGTTTSNAINIANPATGPVIGEAPGNSNKCIGETANFGVGANGTGSLYFEWTKIGSTSVLGTNLFYSISNVNTSHAGAYQVKVIDACGSATSSPASLTVQELTITNDITGGTACQDSPHTMLFAVNGATTYQWYKDGLSITNATLPSYQASESGIYYCVATNGNCTVTSAIVTVTVNNKPATPTISQSGNTLTASTTAEAYVWIVDCTPLTLPTQTITAGSGQYQVVALANGCISDPSNTFSAIVGVTRPETSIDVDIFPNPSSGSFTITTSETPNSIQIYNSLGIVVNKVKTNSTTTDLDLTGMDAGIYYANVSLNGKTAIQKIVIQ